MKKIQTTKIKKTTKKAAVPKAKPKAKPKASAKAVTRKKKTEVSASQKLARTLAELTLTKKAADVKILDLRELTTITDFFVICTVHSDVQAKAVADAVLEGSKQMGERVWHKEGMTQRSWILLDFVDVVVHIFLREIRDFYGLEKLWGDAPFEDIKD